jgi:hypothetical protein
MTTQRVWLTLLPVLLTLVSCHKVPSAEELSTTFKEHKTELLRLVTMSREDSQYRKIPSCCLAPDNMPAQRFREYQSIFYSIKFSGPIFRHAQYPSEIFIYADTWVSIREQPMSVGFIYSPTASLPTVKKIDVPSGMSELFSTMSPCIAFLPLEEHWCLFMEAADRAQSGLPPPCAVSPTK